LPTPSLVKAMHVPALALSLAGIAAPARIIATATTDLSSQRRDADSLRSLVAICRSPVIPERQFYST
jgi:hypothetical protein